MSAPHAAITALRRIEVEIAQGAATLQKELHGVIAYLEKTPCEEAKAVLQEWQKQHRVTEPTAIEKVNRFLLEEGDLKK